MTRATSFKKIVLCHTNDFKPNINDKIGKWVEAHGGIFSKTLTPDVTHLVTSNKAWKRYSAIVQQARRMRTVYVVNFDWLEDSLLKKPVRALHEGSYLFEATSYSRVKKARKKVVTTNAAVNESVCQKLSVPRDKRIETTGVEFDKARQDFEHDMGSAGFHPYADSSGFVYIVTLLRYDLFKRYFEKYRLKLYESDHRPHVYACYTQYTRPGVTKQIRVLAPPGSTWEFAWTMFEKFFRTKVCTTWNERPSAGTEISLDPEPDETAFQYLAPRTGEPEGLRPGHPANPTLATKGTHDETLQQSEQDSVEMHKPDSEDGMVLKRDERLNDNGRNSSLAETQDPGTPD